MDGSVLNYLMKVKRVVNEKDKEVDMCMLEGYEERIKNIAHACFVWFFALMFSS